MADFLKVLAQSAPTAGVLTNAYTTPAGRTAVVSAIVVCNQNATTCLFRVSVAVAGAADATKQYVYYDVPIQGNDTFIASVGLSLGPADVIRVQSDSANVSFGFYGVENT